ncbi:MAG TPA: ADP-glyceromanno-heptose 6-epimerase [Chthoniobacterales bacterium]
MIDLTKGKILVTGGAGFIGSALVWALNLKGIDDILVSDFLGTDEKWRNLVPLRFDDFIPPDQLLDRIQQNPTSLDNIQAVFHLGACSATTERDLGYLMRNNFEFTKILGEWSAQRNIRFTYASSAATYGNGSAGMKDDESILDKLRPLNGYAFSKQRFDLYAARRGLLSQFVGLKYFNVFGPNEGHKGDMRSVVHKAFQQVQTTGKIQLFKSYHPDYGDGEQKRDFLYVKDAVEMTIFLASNPSAAGIFNLGFGRARRWIDLANAVFSALGKPPMIEFIEMPEALRPNYQNFTEANIDKLLGLGFKGPKFSLEEAVRDYVQNYLALGKPLEP